MDVNTPAPEPPPTQRLLLSHPHAPIAPPPLSLYVHLPWCVRKCPYCDFNSHALRGAAPYAEYGQTLLADLDADLRAHAEALAGRPLVSVFFGGGTPSLFAPDRIAAILDGVAARLPLAADAEITLETNPGTVEHGRFDGYRAAGVNRLSFGVQSFDDEKLIALGRIHSAAEAERAIKEAQDAGCANLNLDLMYALPGQTLDGALADLERALTLAPAHVSHYQLTLEPNTLFAAHPPPLPDDDDAFAMQEACQARLAAAGYAQYEVSAYARPDRHAAHNLNYWTFGDYLGIGAGAHGKITDAATGVILRSAKLKVPERYLARAGGGAFGSVHAVAADERAFEFMLNALRLVDGVPLALFAQRTGLDAATIAAPLAAARRQGWLINAPATLQPTPLGLRFHNDLLALFLH
jgi:oxygen-independent coproporphyrinogen-3 oxidase